MPKREQILDVAFATLSVMAIVAFCAAIAWIVSAPFPAPIVIESTFRASSTEHFRGFELHAIEPRDGYDWSYEFTHQWTPEEPWVTQRAVGRAKEAE